MSWSLHTPSCCGVFRVSLLGDAAAMPCVQRAPHWAWWAFALLKHMPPRASVELCAHLHAVGIALCAMMPDQCAQMCHACLRARFLQHQDCPYKCCAIIGASFVQCTQENFCTHNWALQVFAWASKYTCKVQNGESRLSLPKARSLFLTRFEPQKCVNRQFLQLRRTANCARHSCVFCLARDGILRSMALGYLAGSREMYAVVLCFYIALLLTSHSSQCFEIQEAAKRAHCSCRQN